MTDALRGLGVHPGRPVLAVVLPMELVLQRVKCGQEGTLLLAAPAVVVVVRMVSREAGSA